MPRLRHSSGCEIEFTPLEEDKVRVTRLRDTHHFGGERGVSKHLARAWWRGWLSEGFEETKETEHGY